jgi:pimeloyl-ACP methyl ester carboxylesterase
MKTQLTDVPDWFQAFTTLPRNDHSITVDDAAIHYQTWDQTQDQTRDQFQYDHKSKQSLLFVHGHAAHSHWWDFIAPAFIENYRVAAMDMSGAGDSDHRDQYSARGFAEEIYQVARTLGEKTIVVGHSLGGTMTRVCGHLFGKDLGGIVIIDSNISSSRGNRTPPPMPKKKERVYPSLATGMRRFRLRPAQPPPADYVGQYIATHSLKESDAGYSFKLDPAVFAKMTQASAESLPDAVTMIKEMPCPVGFIYGEQSVFFPQVNVEQLKSLFAEDLLKGIADAHHHVFLDQPQAFCQELAAILSTLAVRAA